MTSTHNRRDFLKVIGMGAASLCFSSLFDGCQATMKSESSPNIIIIFADDLGYGDICTYGHPTINTPHIDQMAAEGQKWTNFYAAASVCTPSRAALLTGRLPIRSGMCGNKNPVLFPDSIGGLPAREVTIAEVLKSKGYATACIGKWHLGHLPPYLPTRNGFDYYYGIPYSNDMDAIDGWDIESLCNPEVNSYNVPLIRNEEIIERPADQTTITKRYTEEAIKFITNHKEQPFFLYLAHNMPHVPLFASSSFKGVSKRGIYGDAVEEVDWSVGQVIKTLQKEKLAENTLVIFTSDNGPWLLFKDHGGSAGLLKDGKSTTWEGGMREPSVFWWPGKIKHSVVNDIGSTLDLFTTACVLAGAKVPDDRQMDSLDLSPVLFGTGVSPRKIIFYYRGSTLFAVRKGAFKAHYYTQPAYEPDVEAIHHDPPLLFNLNQDPGEHYNIAQHHPEIIADIQLEVDRHRTNLIKGKSQLDLRIESSG